MVSSKYKLLSHCSSDTNIHLRKQLSSSFIPSVILRQEGHLDNWKQRKTPDTVGNIYINDQNYHLALARALNVMMLTAQRHLVEMVSGD